VFVFQPIPEVAIRTLQAVADVEVFPHLDRMISLDEMIGAARRSDYLLALHENFIPAEVIRANPHLKGIGILGAKTAMVDFDVALEHKLPVVTVDGARVPGGVNRATADLTMAFILNLAYRVVEANEYTHQGKFKQSQTMALMGVGCPDKTVGLIGLGRVGQYLLPRLHAFEMRVIYTKRTRLPVERERELDVAWAEIDDLFRASDFVCVACAYNASTRDMIGERELRLMKPHAYFINTARGRIVQEPALIRALQEGWIAGAALDVYASEPPERWETEVPAALRKLDNVILTPHNGGATWAVRGYMLNEVARGIVSLIKGERPANLMNPEVFGEPTRYPEIYGRGPAVPVTNGGPALYAH
jgi:glyoxylate reductase